MFLDERIKFFEEIIEQDPASKLFFPLAKLYHEKKDIERSISILKQGLSCHPDHIEARLFLIELLSEKSMEKEADLHTQKIKDILLSYPHFWGRWAKLLAKTGQNDLAGFISLIGFCLQSETPRTVGEIIYEYINPEKLWSDSISEKFISSISKEETKEHLEGDKKIEEIDFKTKTMGDILLAQGDAKGAIAIYKELLEQETDRKKIEEIKKSIQEAENKLKSVTFPKKRDDVKKKRRLLRHLRTLVKRFEARVN